MAASASSRRFANAKAAAVLRRCSARVKHDRHQQFAQPGRLSHCRRAVSEFVNVVRAGATTISGEALLCANLGYGLRLVSRAGGVRHTMLFDTGPEGAIFIRNCANLAIPLGEVEHIAVTHGHWDHMGALPAAIDAILQQGGQVTVHVNPDMFNERGVQLKSGTVVPVAKVPLPAELEHHGATVVNSLAERVLLDGHFYYSGEIPRVTSFEKGRVDHLCRTASDAPWQPDPFLMDERMLVVRVRDLGLIVFSACSHAGIVNVCTCRDPDGMLVEEPVSGHSDPLRDGGIASGWGHGGHHSGHRGCATAVSHQIHHYRPLHRVARPARAGQCIWRRRQPVGRRHDLYLHCR